MIKQDGLWLLNGDSLERIKEIPDDYIDLVVTDPPYDIKNTKAGKSFLTDRINNQQNALTDLNITNGFNVAILDELLRVGKNINMYFFCNKSQLPMYIDYFVSNRKCSFDLIKWVKTNPVPAYNNKYMSDTEYCFYARKGGYCNPLNYEDASTLYLDKLNVSDKKLYNHPTIKPLPLVERLIRNSSREGDIIFDPFMGSGTTGVAALRNGRKFIGIELDPTYYGITCDRVLTEASLCSTVSVSDITETSS